MRHFTENFTPDGRVNLKVYLHDGPPALANASARPAVIVFPGGGYGAVSPRESEPVAAAFFGQGYQTFVLTYSVGEEHTFEEALAEAGAAVARIRSMAAEWNTHPDQIAVCGFSAGGHLAAAVSVMGSERPNATILGYPCILANMSKSQKNVLRYDVPSCDEYVDADTPPAYIFHTVSDTLVPVENSLRYADALARAGVPFEMHLFPSGVHGLSLCDGRTSEGMAFLVNSHVAQWVPLCFAWLQGVFPNFKSE